MTALPSIVPLSPGARPTEPGWYVIHHASSRRTVVEVAEESGKLVTYCVGVEQSFSVADGSNFIARIYPDRIGQE